MEITKQKGSSKVEEIKIESEGLLIVKTMNNFRVYYSGACFEKGDLREQVEKKVHDRIASLGEVLDIEATFLYPDQINLGGENYVVGFESEITVEAETQVKAENQGYDLLSHLGQITVVAFKKE